MQYYISFVVAARNDNYGGNFLQRLQLFLNVLFAFWKDHKLNAELIIIEWNPPEENARLCRAINWRNCPQKSAVRIITVPKEIHEKLPNSKNSPIFEYFAKNTGVRRAKGEFILVLNPDLLLSEHLISYLALQKLSSDKFYRADRFDYRGILPPWIPPRLVLFIARLRIFALCGETIGRKQRLYSIVSGRWPSVYRGWWKGVPVEGPAITLRDISDWSPAGVYINNSGDFLLAAREAWHRIRGYPENPETFSHLDSYGCHQLQAIKLEQTLFLPPFMIMHADHSRAQSAKRPTITHEKLLTDLKKIRDGLLNPVFNDTDWGLGNHELEEMTVDLFAK